jgi:hypothetical protein
VKNNYEMQSGAPDSWTVFWRDKENILTTVVFNGPNSEQLAKAYKSFLVLADILG